MAYERDGTAVVVTETTSTVETVRQLTVQQMTYLNDERSDTWNILNNYDFAGTLGMSTLTFVFPELRNISGYFIHRSNASGEAAFSSVTGIQTSANTTNGINGTWSTASASVSNGTSNYPNYRTVNTVAFLSVKAIKFRFAGWSEVYSQSIYNATMMSVHLYGEKTTTGNSLVFWHPTANTALVPADIDFGDIRRETTTVKTFRVKNASASLTANNVSLTVVSNSGQSSVIGEHTFSTDGGTTYGASRTISSIAPSAISSVIRLRRLTTASSLLATHSSTVSAVAGSWT